MGYYDPPETEYPRVKCMLCGCAGSCENIDCYFDIPDDSLFELGVEEDIWAEMAKCRNNALEENNFECLPCPYCKEAGGLYDPDVVHETYYLMQNDQTVPY